MQFAEGIQIICLINRYIKIKYHPDIIRFNWHDLSSGENAYINIFSRFFDFPFINKNIETIILLLDEAELGFHPKWQKKFIHSLIETLPTLVNSMNEGNKIDIQVILTSHSPFILSDLPKESIIFLQYDDQKKANVLSDLKNHEKTFGANIHTLLSDAFFMDDGLIGEFAKEKINDLFTYLISETDNKFNYDSAKQLIDLIGEPIVKLQLIQLFDKKFAKKSEIKWIEDQIEQLEKRKNELK